MGSCVFVPQAWDGPKQGSSGAKTFREDVLFLFVLVAGSSSHVFEAVAVGSAEGERCRGRGLQGGTLPSGECCATKTSV